MFTLTLVKKSILFIQCIILYFGYAKSVKTYQVHRVNATSYLVTAYPEIDYDYFKPKENMKDIDIKSAKTFNYDKKLTLLFETTLSTVLVDEKRNIRKNKVSDEFIKKVREQYFKEYFATMKTPISKASLIPDKIKPYVNFLKKNTDTIYNSTSITASERNLLKVRRLATLLIDEINNHPENAIEENHLKTK